MARALLAGVFGGLLYAQGAAGQIDPNLVGWWRFEEGGGTVAVDSSGHGNHGTLMGDPEWVEGWDGLALDLDGEGEYIGIGKVASELGIGGSRARTIALWAYVRSFDGGGLYEMGGDGTREGFSLSTRGEERGWRAGYGGIDANFVTYSADEWVHLAHVYGGSRAKVYVNASYPRSRQLVLRTSDEKTLKIGTSGDAAFDGLIDDVRLYDRAATRDEVRRIMYGSPFLSSDPRPADGVLTDIARASVLSWEAGALAVEHDVYFGTDEDAVREATVDTEGVYRGRQPVDVASYVPPEGPLEWNASYYWRVDEITVGGGITEGKVWSFRTAAYLIVDDFESYDDEDNWIFDTWIDGFVNGTRFGVDTLTMYFIGSPVAFAERANGNLVIGGIGPGWDEDADQLRFVYKQLGGDGSIVARVESLSDTGPWDQGGVMIRETFDDDGLYVAALVTTGHGVSFQYRRAAGEAAGQTRREGRTAPYWVRLTREGDTFTASCSSDGLRWTPVAERPSGSEVEIPMSSAVWVGLAVSSHGWWPAASVEFSGVSTAGDVTGSWEVGEIGVAQPRGNSLDRMYVGLVDEAGGLAMVNHPDDPLAIGAASWERWDIPLSVFASGGVDVTRVTQMVIGVGDRDNPVPGGEGMVYFDDIRLTRSGHISGPSVVD